MHTALEQRARGRLTRRKHTHGDGSLRVVRVGLLGLGNVGQAVVRTNERWRARLAERGLDVQICSALVRNPARARRCTVQDALVTSDPAQFLAQPYDVVIEVLGGIEPAGTLVRRLLTAGIPVITANKSLLAAQGAALRRLARRSQTPLVVEASVLAGVPFLGSLARRPLASRVDRICGILNGTSNYILSAMTREGASCESALRRAQELGLAEPDAHNDVHGIDAAEKLVVLLGELGVAELPTAAIETTGIDSITAADLTQAQAWGGVIKPVAFAEHCDGACAVYVGPAFLRHAHALAGIDGLQNAVQLSAAPVGDLLFAGPGAGPDATAATLLDDVVELATGRRRRTVTVAEPPTPTLSCVAPATPWFVRLDFATVSPPFERVLEFLGGHGVWVRQSAVLEHAPNLTHVFALTCVCARPRLAGALTALRDAAVCTPAFIRALEK